jgi:acetyltransferase-like isoleucine patch superfamily enzyme
MKKLTELSEKKKVRDVHVGENVRIFDFVNLYECEIGNDSRIGTFVEIQKGVIIGKNCKISSHSFICEGVTIEDNVFIGHGVMFTNDKRPRAVNADGTMQSPEDWTVIPTVVKSGASIGSNVTILPGITIGEYALVGAGAVVASSVQANAIVTGNPARVVGYVDTKRGGVTYRTVPPSGDAFPSVVQTTVAGVALHRLKRVENMRGNLLVGEFGRELPFVPARFFTVFDVPRARVRGEHAHRRCELFLVCLKGNCAVVVEDGSSREEILLDSPDFGAYLPPMIWTTLYKFSSDAMLLVFASVYYDPEDYIRDYAVYLRSLQDQPNQDSV